MKISDVREKGPGLHAVMSLSYSEFQDGVSKAHMPLIYRTQQLTAFLRSASWKGDGGFSSLQECGFSLLKAL